MVLPTHDVESIDSGHFAPDEQPGQVTQVLQEFIAKRAATRKMPAFDKPLDFWGQATEKADICRRTGTPRKVLDG